MVIFAKHRLSNAIVIVLLKAEQSDMYGEEATLPLEDETSYRCRAYHQKKDSYSDEHFFGKELCEARES